jgi:type I restriction enzyme, S subunit
MQAALRWGETQLGTVAHIDRLIVPPERIQSGSRYVGLEHIDSDGTIVSATVAAGDLRSNKFAFSERHVLFGKLRPYLRKIARPSFSGVCSTDILPILPGRDLDRDYLFHLLRQPSMVSLATARSDGANLPRLAPKALLEFRLSLPPLYEQRRLAAILDKADGIRRKRRESLQLSDEFLRSAFLEIFGDPVRNEKGWKMVKLADCMLEKPVIGTITPASDTGELAVIRVGELGKYDVAIERASRVTVSADEFLRFEAREGDLLLARAIGSEQHLGKASVMQIHPDRVLFDSHVMRLRFDPAQALSSFVWQLLRSGGGRRLLLKQGGRTAVQFNINASQLAEMQLPLPPVEQQKRFLTLALRARAIQSKQNAASMTTDLLFHSLALSAFGPNH